MSEEKCLEIDTTSVPEAKGDFRFIRWIGIIIAAILLAIAGGIYLYDDQEDQVERQYKTVNTAHTNMACSGNIGLIVSKEWTIVDVPPRCDAQIWRNETDKIDIKTIPEEKIHSAETRSKDARFESDKIAIRSATGQPIHISISFHPYGTR